MDRSATTGGAVARRTSLFSTSWTDGHRGLLALLSLIIVLACADSNITSVGSDESEPTLSNPAPSLAEAEMSIVSGGGQEGEVASYLPELLVAKVVDAHGQSVAGAPVEWVFYQGAGTLGDGQPSDRLSTVTDSEGKVSVRWQLGARQGVQSASAEIAAAPAPVSGARTTGLAPDHGNGKKVGFEANATPGDIQSISVSPSEATVQVGDSLQMTATAIDRFGNVVGGLSHQWRTSDENLVQISDAGMAYAVASGAGTITAKHKSVEGTASLMSSESADPLPPSAWIVEPSESVTIALGDTVTLQGDATDSDGSIASHRWEFGDGNGASVEDPGPYVYSSEGTFTVSYRVTDDQGLTSATDTSMVTVTSQLNASPTASIVSPSRDTTVTLGDAVDFQGTSGDEDGSVVSHNWDMGDGNSASVEDPGNHTYAAEGSYTVTYQVTDDDGATAGASHTITVSQGDETSDTEVPTVPTDLSAATVSSSQIDLSWSSSSDNVGVKGYYVYRDASQVADVVTTSYSDAGLGASTTHSYTVAAYDAAGNVSSQSSGASATTDAEDGSGLSGVSIPSEGSFTDRGVVLTPSSGEWDTRWTYGTPGTVLKKDDTYYMYYVGAPSDRSDGGPAYRAVGVATSTDGRTWTKSSSNPIIPWSQLNSNGDYEEGAWRLAAMLDDDGTILLYVTELDGSGGSVNGSIVLFTSSDGLNFTDRGVVVDHADTDFPGSDELGMLGAVREPEGGDYHLFYTGKGGGVEWDGVHTGAVNRDGFTFGSELLDLSSEVRFGSNPIRLSDTEWMVTWGLYGGDIRIHTTSDLARLGSYFGTWTSLTEGNHALYLDRSRNEWLLLVAEGSAGAPSGLRLFTAPVVYPMD